MSQLQLVSISDALYCRWHWCIGALLHCGAGDIVAGALQCIGAPLHCDAGDIGAGALVQQHCGAGDIPGVILPILAGRTISQLDSGTLLPFEWPV